MGLYNFVFIIFKNRSRFYYNMFISLMEIMDVIIMICVVGFVFMTTFKTQTKSKYGDDIDKYLTRSRFSFNWTNFWFAAMVTAPAIILHELGHKITALSFGLSATFHAAYVWLLIAIVLRLVNFPFVFFVPAYVSISGPATITQSTLIAFAGPLVNLILFVLGYIILKSHKKLSPKAMQFWTLTKNINLFLFIFNMIPIPGFDGFTVFSGIWRLIGL